MLDKVVVARRFQNPVNKPGSKEIHHTIKHTRSKRAHSKNRSNRVKQHLTIQLFTYKNVGKQLNSGGAEGGKNRCVFLATETLRYCFRLFP